MVPAKSSVFHVGFDDTDSSDGSCTTFVCYNLVRALLRSKKAKLLDYPNLIRLNPNIPWKTRGNAALGLRLSSSLDRKELFNVCKRYIERYSDSPRANAGLVMFKGTEVPTRIANFSRRALYTVLGTREAFELIKEFEMDSFSLRSRQGLVGAVAAVGNLLLSDHTFELIAYREDLSRERKIDNSKIVAMSIATFPETFSSYDSSFDRVMIAPHGPDPVLCGIRGETADAVKHAFNLIRPLENLLGWMIFRSNQGTGEHLVEGIGLKRPSVYASGKIVGEVITTPKSMIGGHVYFAIRNGDGEIGCACYEPTACLRKSAMSLVVGDILEVAGGVRKPTSTHPRILNLEYLKPIKLARKISYSNPKCEKCDVSMSSMGKLQGFRCDKCGKRSSQGRIEKEQARELMLERIYMPPVKAHRHLTKPEHRYSICGKRTSIPVKLIDRWFS